MYCELTENTIGQIDILLVVCHLSMSVPENMKIMAKIIDFYITGKQKFEEDI